MKYLSEFPKNFKDLSRWELEGLLNSYGGKVTNVANDFFIFDTNNIDKIIKRITFSKRIGLILDNSEFPLILKENETYAIRMFNSSNGDLIKEVARQIEGKVNLSNPDRKFFVYDYNDNKIIIDTLYERSVSDLIDKRYQGRPFNHPSSISPLLARGMINVSGVKEGDSIIDPFAGTGTILIEAFRMGINAIGIDKNIKMVKGGNSNLKYFNYKESIIQGDFTEINNFVEPFTIITDPPYGRGSKIFSESRRTLYKNFFSILSGIKGMNAVFCLPGEEMVDEMSNYLNFTVVEKIRVHSSLTRIVVKTSSD